MKIVQVHNYYLQFGGEDKVFAAEGDLLTDFGHQVIKLTESNSQVVSKNLLPTSFNMIWSRESRLKLQNLLSLAKPDVVHFHNTFFRISPSAYYACRAGDVPVVQTLHNYRLLCPAATFLRQGKICENCINQFIPLAGIQYKCWRNSRPASSVVATMLAFHRLIGTWQKQVDLYIALTEFSRQKFISGGLPKDKIVVKPNFLFSDPGFNKADQNIVLFVGRISQEKGVTTLLQACRFVPTIPLQIIGDGPLFEQLSNQTQQNSLNQIAWLGQKEQVETLRKIKQSRFIVCPSECYETFGLVIIEAFACGKPVIASRLGAMVELVEDGKTGLLFEPGNAEDLASKMRWAWEHKEEMQRMGENARRVYEEKYTPEKNYQMLMAIYEKAIENHRARKSSST